MPLVHSSSDEAVGTNIKRETEAGKPRKQAIAIALQTQRDAGGKGQGKFYSGILAMQPEVASTGGGLSRNSGK